MIMLGAVVVTVSLIVACYSRAEIKEIAKSSNDSETIQKKKEKCKKVCFISLMIAVLGMIILITFSPPQKKHEYDMYEDGIHYQDKNGDWHHYEIKK